MKRINILMGILLLMGSFCACTRQPERLSITHTAMGTVVQEILYVTNENQGEDILQQIQESLTNLEKDYLSWREAGSQVALINRHAGSKEGVLIEEELYQYLVEIQDISAKSQGALDITLGKVTRLWNLDDWAALGAEEQQKFSVPEVESLQEALKDTGYERILLKEGYVAIPDGMSLDLGAVGKGIACDRIGTILKEQEELAGAVISVGGSILTYGTKPGGNPWNVAIVHPREDGVCLGTLSLKGEWYISTSGDYERFVEQGERRFHHIINPENGYPADSGLCSVTILSKSGLVSDALSTACFVLGAEKGLGLAKEFGVEALFVTEKQEIIMTEGMEELFKEAN